MSGCLQKGTEPNSYVLDNVEGNGPKTIGVVSSTANLAPDLGHKIEVTGVWPYLLTNRKRTKTCRMPHIT
jgi:hypothetical protein